MIFKLIQNEKKEKENLSAKQEEFIAALNKNLGNIVAASKITGITRELHYYWKNTNAIYAAQANEIKEIVLDFAEDALHKLIEEHNVAAVIFKLKCLGKDRGYVEKQQVELNIDVTKLTDEQLLAIVNSKSESGTGITKTEK